MLQACARLDAQLGLDVFDVILHGVQTDAEAHGNLAVVEAVPHEVHDTPLRSREHVWVRRPPSSSG